MNSDLIPTICVAIVLVLILLLGIIKLNNEPLNNLVSIRETHNCVAIGVDNSLTVYRCDDGIRREDDEKARK
jgi:hypothetical protein